MKKAYSLLSAIILFLITGCEDKKDQNSTMELENTTTIVQSDKNQSLENEDGPFNGINFIPHAEPYSFLLNDRHNMSYKGVIKDKTILLEGVNAPIIVVHFFATWCPPCAGEAPYLSDLQKKYAQEVLVAGVTVNDTPNETLEQFIEQNDADYYISIADENDRFAAKMAEVLNLEGNSSLPLTVIYYQGEYLVHYEGAVPIEILDHDIQKAIKNINEE